MLQCAMAHTQAKTLAEALRSDTPPQSRLYIECAGEFGMPLQCRHCEDARCISVCPVKAISRVSPDSPVLLDADRCTGCQFCLLACPFGIIDLSREGKAVVKCDLCIQRTEAGERPACVEACPTGAIQLVELDENLRCQRRDLFEHVSASAQDQDQTTEAEMACCGQCGQAFAKVKMLRVIRKKLPEGVELPSICPDCRRKKTTEKLHAMGCAVQSPSQKTRDIGKQEK